MDGLFSERGAGTRYDQHPRAFGGSKHSHPDLPLEPVASVLSRGYKCT